MRATTIRDCSSCRATNVHNMDHCLICQAPLSIVESKSDHTISSNGIGLEKIAVKRTVDTSETRVCSECKQMIDSDASYCSECGAVVGEQKPGESYKICPACKEPVDSDSVYCSQCWELLR